jgi:PAS domain S-box-containing protein
MMDKLDEPLFKTAQARRWAANLSIVISLPLIALGGFVAHHATQQRIKATAEKEAALAAREQAVAAEEQMSKQVELLRALTEDSKRSVASVDLNGNVYTWSQNAEDVFEWEASEIIGKPIVILMRPENRGKHLKAFEAAKRMPLKDAKTVRLECDAITKSGKNRKVFITTFWVPDEKMGKVAMAIFDRKRDVIEVDATEIPSVRKVNP